MNIFLPCTLIFRYMLLLLYDYYYSILLDHTQHGFNNYMTSKEPHDDMWIQKHTDASEQGKYRHKM